MTPSSWSNARPHMTSLPNKIWTFWRMKLCVLSGQSQQHDKHAANQKPPPLRSCIPPKSEVFNSANDFFVFFSSCMESCTIWVLPHRDSYQMKQSTVDPESRHSLKQKMIMAASLPETHINTNTTSHSAIMMCYKFQSLHDHDQVYPWATVTIEAHIVEVAWRCLSLSMLLLLNQASSQYYVVIALSTAPWLLGHCSCKCISYCVWYHSLQFSKLCWCCWLLLICLGFACMW